MDGGRQKLGRARGPRAFSDDEAPTKPRSGVVIVARRTGEIASRPTAVKVKTIRIARPQLVMQAPAPARRVNARPPSLPEPETLPRPLPRAPAALRDLPSFDDADAVETLQMPPRVPPAPPEPPALPRRTRERRFVTPPASAALRAAPRVARRRDRPAWALRIALVLLLLAVEIVLADPARFGIDLSEVLLPTIHDIVTSPDP